MELWRDADLRPATADLPDDGYLQAAREEFREWDIIAVFGGYLAVPAGTVVVRSTTPGGVAAKLRRLRAEIEDEP